MKFRRSQSALLLTIAASALFLAGCSTVSSRIEKNPVAYQHLSPASQALVSKGEIREGMSREAVFLAWGQPDQKAMGSVKGRTSETWIYLAYYDSYPSYSFGGGFYSGGFYGGRGGYGHHGHHRSFYYEPFYDPFLYSSPVQVAYPYRTATFEGGRVVAYKLLSPRR